MTEGLIQLLIYKYVVLCHSLTQQLATKH